MLAGNVETNKIDKILIIDRSEDWLKRYHPSWYELIEREFRKTEEFLAPSVWGAIYIRADELSNDPYREEITGRLNVHGRYSRRSAGDCPVTEDVSDRLLRLPFYYSLPGDDQARVVSAIKEFDMV
jgi:dTDP-4-amino-4,6-dideoxygalactose transaminase